MRLACPNCDARYEVPDEAIPAEGRDVQCSSCGTAWFQTGSDRPLAADAKPLPFAERQSDAVVAASMPADAAPTENDALPPAAAALPGDAEAKAAAPPPVQDEDFSLEDSLTAMLAQEEAEARMQAEAKAAELQQRSHPADAAQQNLAAADRHEAFTSADAASEGEAATEVASEMAKAAKSQADIDASVATSPPTSTPAGTDPILTHLPKRELEESVRAILREEADREANARLLDTQRLANRRMTAEVEAEAEAVVQPQPEPDLGPDDHASVTHPPAPPAMAATATEAEAEAEPPLAAMPATAADATPARRDLLPNVEEINSTLQPNDQGLTAAPVDRPKPRSGAFRSGFLLALIALALASAVYLGAAKIGHELPALQPQLQAYVEMVDALRLWLNAALDGLTQKLRGA